MASQDQYAYDKLYKLYESGTIRPAEMEELRRLDSILRPQWAAAMVEEQSYGRDNPAMMYDPYADKARPLSDRARTAASEILPEYIVSNLFGRPASKDFMDREGLLGLIGAKDASRLADAPVNAYMGNYGSAAADVGMGALGALNFVGGGGLLSKMAPRVGKGVSSVADAARDAYVYGERLRAPGGYTAILGRPSVVSMPEGGTYSAMPISPIESAARDYMTARGMDTTPLMGYPRQSPERAQLIAAAYDAMKSDPSNPAVKRAYDALIQETLDQYKAIKDTGIDIRFLEEGMSDPYAMSPAMGYRDLVENGRLWVFPTDFGFGSGSAFDPRENPLLTSVGRIGDKPNAVANDAFRAVHDIFGHFGPGNPYFRAPGEERAWLEHSRMYSPEARGAMTSETRGQNSWLNFGPHGDFNRTALGKDTIFADQKAGLMSPWTYEQSGMPVGEERDALIRQLMEWGVLK